MQTAPSSCLAAALHHPYLSQTGAAPEQKLPSVPNCRQTLIRGWVEPTKPQLLQGHPDRSKAGLWHQPGLSAQSRTSFATAGRSRGLAVPRRKSLAGRKERSCPPAGCTAPTALSSESVSLKPAPNKPGEGKCRKMSACSACSESPGALQGCLLRAVLQAWGSAPAAPSPGEFSQYACRGDLPGSHVPAPVSLCHQQDQGWG